MYLYIEKIEIDVFIHLPYPIKNEEYLEVKCIQTCNYFLEWDVGDYLFSSRCLEFYTIPVIWFVGLMQLSHVIGCLFSLSLTLPDDNCLGVGVRSPVTQMLAPDRSRVITWPRYLPLIGREGVGVRSPSGGIRWDLWDGKQQHCVPDTMKSQSSGALTTKCECLPLSLTDGPVG